MDDFIKMLEELNKLLDQINADIKSCIELVKE